MVEVWLSDDGNPGGNVIAPVETRNEASNEYRNHDHRNNEHRNTGHSAITRAAERFLEQYGDPLVMNTYLKVTILVLTAVCLALAALTYKSQNALANMHP